MDFRHKATKDGEYTISVNPENVELDYLHLIDNLTGSDVDLFPPLRGGQGESKQSSYTFQAKTTDYASRFRLVFASKNEDGPSTGSGTFAYISNGEIRLLVETQNLASLQVIDMMGRVIASTDTAHNVSTDGIPAGVYVLRLIDGEIVRTQKLVIE